MADDRLQELLQLAGIHPSDGQAGQATAWLRGAIKDLRHDNGTPVKRPLASHHNDLLTDIEKTAKKLIKRLERLRRYPHSQHAFWRCRAFGPIYNDRVEVREVLSTLEAIVLAANLAKDRHQGRPREARKQHVVDLAFAFFVRFSPRAPSGTPTGAFAKFARKFYFAVVDSDAEQDGGLDRQIRQALTRLPIELERARQKSGKKSRVSS